MMKMKSAVKAVSVVCNTDIAWAAGFFEGEGCWNLYTQRNGSKTVRASLGQKGVNGKELLDKFLQIAGVGKIYKNSPRTNGTIMYYWFTSKIGDAEKVFNVLSPWLSKTRTAKFNTLNKQEKKSRDV